MNHVFRGVITILVLSAMLFSAMPEAGAAETPRTLQGTTFLNLPARGFGGPTVSSTLTLTQQTELNGKLFFSGSVVYGSQKTPIQLAGTFAKSMLNANDLVGHFEDSSGNFQVVNISLRRKAATSVLNTAAAQTMSGQDMLLIYLMYKGTREFSLFEAPLASDPDFLPLISATDLSGKAAFNDDYWQSTVFEAMSSGVTKVEPTTTGAVQPDYTVDVYSETYPVGQYGDTLTYMIMVYASEDMPNNQFTTFCEVTRKWTESTSPTWRSETSPFVIGSYNYSVVFKGLLTGDMSNSGDAFSAGWFGGTYTTRNQGPQITIDIGYQVPGTPISVDWSFPINFPNYTAVSTAGTIANLLGPNPQTEYVKAVNWNYRNSYLASTGQQFVAFLLTANRGGGLKQRAMQVEWMCPVCYDNGTYRSCMTLHTTVNYTSGS